MKVEGLHFLVGEFAGEGEWGGEPFRCRTRGVLLLERFIEFDVDAVRGDGHSHRERVMFHPHGDGVAVQLFPDRGDVQAFDVTEREPGTIYELAFRPPAGSHLGAQRWTITRTDAGYDEVYEIDTGDGAFRTSVRCSYRRVSE